MRTVLSLSLAAAVAAVVSARPAIAAPPPPLPAQPAVSEPVDEQSEFEKGRNAYRAHEYEEADARFLRMLDPQHGTLHDRLLVKQARMYWAATRLALHQDEDARSLFEIILTEDHDYEPDPLAFPTEVVNAFIDTRGRIRDKLEAEARERYRIAAERRANEEEAKAREAARLQMLEKLAGETEVTEKHRRWIALLPFGVGQFQNGQRTAGWAFLSTEGALLAAGIVTVPIYIYDLGEVSQTYPTSHTVAQEWTDRANSIRILNLSLYGGLAVTAIVGAIQAEIAFVPESTHTEPRAVPGLPPTTDKGAPPHATSALPFTFGAALLPGRDGHGVSGASLGVGGTF